MSSTPPFPSTTARATQRRVPQPRAAKSLRDEILDKRVNRIVSSNLKSDCNFYKPLTLEVNMGYTHNSRTSMPISPRCNLQGNINGGP
jgi:hypothetical protein